VKLWHTLFQLLLHYLSHLFPLKTFLKEERRRRATEKSDRRLCFSRERVEKREGDV
jgi:hypothetical protein